MDQYETIPDVLNVAETCAASISIDDLIELCEDKDIEPPLKTSIKLTYGPIRGSDTLRQRLAYLYSVRVATPMLADNVLIMPGAIAANFLTLYALLNPGDHVICVYPTYQQLYSVPESLGAEVSLWKLKKAKKYVPDLADLDALIKENTKMIIINNPNNPTGATIPKSVLTGLVDRARERNIIVISDEVYRPLFHGISPTDEEYPPSLISMGYARTVVTGSMSKAYALAGIRVGWIASRDKAIIEILASARDYTTISVSQVDDRIASYALSTSVLHALLRRNINLAKTNLAILEAFVDKHDEICSWVKPTAGTTAFIKFENDDKPVDDVRLCLDLLEKTKVMVMPGSRCFGDNKDFRGFVRFGYVCETEVLKEGLARLEKYLKEEFPQL
jgi:aspartate/methionine/tyrosine aminotransferase